MSTEFLRGLRPCNPDEPETRLSDFYLFSVKGIANPRLHALGWRDPGDASGARMYYYKMSDGLLEIEVSRDRHGQLQRRVTDFIVDAPTLVEMLGTTEPMTVARIAD